MNRFLYFISACLLVLSSISCGNRTADIFFDDIESFVQEYPDSALSLLRSFPKETLSSKRIQARYSLLFAMSLDKCYIDTTDLDIIFPASSYFSKHGSAEDRMKAYFYQGRIYSNGGDDNEAILNYTLALEDSADVSDSHYKELVNSAISDAFSRNYNSEQELLYTMAALRYGRASHDSVGVWAITGHLASCYANLRKWEDAEKTFQDFFAMPVLDSLTYFRRRISYAKMLVFKSDATPGLCISILDEVSDQMPQAMTLEAYCIYAYAHQLLKDTDVVNQLLEELEPYAEYDNIVKSWRYRIYREQGRYEQAIGDLEQSVLAQDSIIVATLEQSLIQSQRDYLQMKARALKEENNYERQKSITIVVLFLIAIAVLSLLFVRRRAVLKKRMQELSALYQGVQQMLELQNERNAEINTRLEQKEEALLVLRKQFASNYKAQYKALNTLCSAYFSPIKKDRKDLLYDEAMRYVSTIVADRESQSKFMTVVDSSLNNILTKLRADLPNHKESDFIFLMYIIIGFDATTIANLTGYSVGSVYTKKNRLKNEITNLSSENRDFYLEYLT